MTCSIFYFRVISNKKLLWNVRWRNEKGRKGDISTQFVMLELVAVRCTTNDNSNSKYRRGFGHVYDCLLRLQSAFAAGKNEGWRRRWQRARESERASDLINWSSDNFEEEGNAPCWSNRFPTQGCTVRSTCSGPPVNRRNLFSTFRMKHSKWFLKRTRKSQKLKKKKGCCSKTFLVTTHVSVIGHRNSGGLS